MYCLSAAAQQPTITIQKRSELVTVPVIVTDKTGKPIHGIEAVGRLLNGPFTATFGCSSSFGHPSFVICPSNLLLFSAI
ncbi:MAG: hypothetical protein ROO76_20545 [Terriglobia bacterium]|nr:hypothetical protein [Terriglobia bacterium]